MTGDPALLGVAGGLGAFVITCLSGHPLLLEQVAYPFWILLGLASGMVLRARDVAASKSLETAPSRLTPVGTWAAATIGILLVISIPVRVHSAARNTSFSRVAFGFYEWERDPRGLPFRWTGGEASFYVPTGVRTVEIPLRAWNPTPERPTSVGIDVNGTTVRELVIDHGAWTSTVVPLPPQAPDRYWRIDIRVAPTIQPSRLAAGIADDRVLGVRVGEIQLTPDPDKRPPEDRAIK
jgi:hypothetical protein